MGLLLTLNSPNQIAFALSNPVSEIRGGGSTGLPVKKDLKYPLIWENDNGNFNVVPKSEKERALDDAKFPPEGGFFRRLFKRQRKYVFYVRNEDDERHARMIVSADKEASVKKENAFVFKLWKLPLKWMTTKEKTYMK